MLKSVTRSVSSIRTLLIAGASAAVAVAAMGFSGGAHARSDVSFSIGIGTPGLVIGASNAYPVYSAPVYSQPAYGYYPQPVYGQPQPVYVQPRPFYNPHPIYVQAPVYVAPPPVYYGGGYYRHPGHGQGYRGRDGHHRGHGKHRGHGHDD